MSAVENFTVQNNVLFDNTSFIGSHGPNCSKTDNVPTPQPFVASNDSITQCRLQSNFTVLPDATSLTCIIPSDGDYWPFGGLPTPIVPGEDVPPSQTSKPKKNGSNSNASVTVFGLSLSIPLGIIAALIGT